MLTTYFERISVTLIHILLIDAVSLDNILFGMLYCVICCENDLNHEQFSLLLGVQQILKSFLNLMSPFSS
jgi:hypothetical protein